MHCSPPETLIRSSEKNYFKQLISFNKGPFYYYFLRMHHTIKKGERDSDHSVLPFHVSPDYRIQEAFLSLARCPVNGPALPLFHAQENPGEGKRQTCSTLKTKSRLRHSVCSKYLHLQLSLNRLHSSTCLYSLHLTWKPRTIGHHHPQFNTHWVLTHFY